MKPVTDPTDNSTDAQNVAVNAEYDPINTKNATINNEPFKYFVFGDKSAESNINVAENIINKIAPINDPTDAMIAAINSGDAEDAIIRDIDAGTDAII